MNDTTLAEAVEAANWDQQSDALSVYRACEQLTDARHKRGVRYSVALIVTLVLLGKLAGMTSLAGIAQWVRLRGEWLSQVLPTRRTSFPCAATYSNVLRAVDAEQVRAVLNDLLTRVRAERAAQDQVRDQPWQELAEQEHLALDGKTLRGTLGHRAPDQQQMHQLALYETQTGVLLKEAITGEKQNELSIVSQFLTPTLVQGRIISADALHTQHLFCWAVTRWLGDYVLLAKDNQPTLAEDERLFFREPPVDCRDWRTARTIDKGHGRLEIRELIASTDLNAFLASKWVGVAQVFQLTRTVYEQGQMRQEVVYGLTSLPSKHADAARLLAFVRAHWLIENRLHWRRDVTLREDHSQVRKGQAPRLQALLNSFVLALCDLIGVRNIPQQQRLFDAQPMLAVRLLLGPLMTFKSPWQVQVAYCVKEGKVIK